MSKNKLIILASAFVVASLLLGYKMYHEKISKTEEFLCIVNNNGTWAWNDIKIGVSTSKDLTDSLGQPEITSTFEHKESNTSGSVYTYLIFDPKASKTPDSVYTFSSNVSFVRFILINDIVIALEPHPDGYFLGKSDITYSDLINVYGNPELLGFSNHISHSRTAVWPDKGVQSTINIFDPRKNPSLISNPKIAQVTNIQYFCATTETEYMSSILSWYTESRPGGDVIDLFPMNPFILDD